jgi:N-acetylglucosaminyldiphosphoundecaprenol N-acetyl-beta-D-mannosaminyltransferase
MLSLLPSHNVLGIDVAAIDLKRAVEKIGDWVDYDQREYVCVTDAHCIIQAHRNPEIRQVYQNAGLVTPDGMPLVWMCRWGGHKDTSRVYGPDLMLAVMADPALRTRRHFFYGGAEGVAEKLTGILAARYPGLNIVGTHCPPFKPYTDQEAQAVIDDINAAAPDMIWICLGAPKQELWMAKYRAQLNAPVLLGVGAAFDFLSGTKPQAPRWMQRSGLEWLFRMGTEPRRLVPRYFATIPYFVYLALAQISGLRRFSVEHP